MRSGFALLGVAAIVATLGLSPARAAETEDDLPPGQGRHETFVYCIACHGLDLIKRQSMSREAWDDILRLMVTRHGMNEIDAPDRAKILDYLAATYPVRVDPRGGWRNPFAPN